MIDRLWPLRSNAVNRAGATSPETVTPLRYTRAFPSREVIHALLHKL
jgi:hypothetical protein